MSQESLELNIHSGVISNISVRKKNDEDAHISLDLKIEAEPHAGPWLARWLGMDDTLEMKAMLWNYDNDECHRKALNISTIKLDTEIKGSICTIQYLGRFTGDINKVQFIPFGEEQVSIAFNFTIPQINESQLENFALALHSERSMTFLEQPNLFDQTLDKEGGAGETTEEQADVEDGLENDPLYEPAAKHVVESKNTSISNLQRRYKIGYNRAARLIEAMETLGIVSEMSTNGERTVLVDELPEITDSSIDANSIDGAPSEDHRKARDHAIEQQKITTSRIQQLVGCGGNKATQIMDWLEQTGVVGPIVNRKREVLIKPEAVTE